MKDRAVGTTKLRNTELIIAIVVAAPASMLASQRPTAESSIRVVFSESRTHELPQMSPGSAAPR